MRSVNAVAQMNNISDELIAYREEVRVSLEALAKKLVSDAFTESLKISTEMGDKTTIYRVACPKDCLGQIIGAKGKNIEALRTLLYAVCARRGIRAIIEVPHYPK